MELSTAHHYSSERDKDWHVRCHIPSYEVEQVLHIPEENHLLRGFASGML